jgi:peptide/nickel transport system permease protein
VTTLITRRLGAMVLVLILLTATVFMLQHNTPTDPVHAFLGANASPEAIAAATHALGYDRPILVQYASYLAGLAHGDFATSLRTRNPVAADLGQYLPATAELAIFGLLLALLLGGLLGMATALRVRGSGPLRVLMTASASTPPFLLALGGLLFFYSWLGWLPANGRTDMADPPTGPTGFLTVDTLLQGDLGGFADAAAHLILPGVCIALLPAVSIGRVLRSSLVDALSTEYVRTARAKGQSEARVVARHAVRNSIGPALSMTGLQVGGMFAGVVVIETVFGWPGIGLYTTQSISHSDFPAIAGVTVVLGVGYVLVNTLVDILQRMADPRIAL